MFNTLTIPQIKAIRYEYDKLKTEKERQDHIKKIAEEVYKRRHELFELWEKERNTF